jgi:predicted enzyme related to lactoylglutathione lyase
MSQNKNNQIVWCDIPVTNLDRAIKFYSAVLGSPVKKESMPGMEFGLLPHVEDSVSGCLVVMEDRKPSVDGPMIYLNASGRLDDAIAAVTANGGKIVKPKHPIGPYGFRAVLLDTEGNRIALHSN